MNNDEQQEKQQKFIASGFVKRDDPKPPTHKYELSHNDKKFLRSLKIDPDK